MEVEEPLSQRSILWPVDVGLLKREEVNQEAQSLLYNQQVYLHLEACRGSAGLLGWPCVECADEHCVEFSAHRHMRL